VQEKIVSKDRESEFRMKDKQTKYIKGIITGFSIGLIIGYLLGRIIFPLLERLILK